MKVWRINLKPATSGVDPREFCLAKGILGVGWALGDAESLSWEEYSRVPREEKWKGWAAALGALHDRMKVNDLVWTRDRQGNYYLGRVAGPWRYIGTEEHRQAAIVNVRPCKWIKVGTTDAVPGPIVHGFRGQTLRAASGGKTVRAFSQFKYNALADDYTYEIEPLDIELFSLLHADDLEDLVALYLQERGYRVIPSSAKKGTPRYEFVLRHADDGRKVVAQVKTKEDLNARAYTDIEADEVFLLSAKGKCRGNPGSGVYCLDPAELKRFAYERRSVMPDKIRTWMDMADELRV